MEAAGQHPGGAAPTPRSGRCSGLTPAGSTPHRWDTSTFGKRPPVWPAFLVSKALGGWAGRSRKSPRVGVGTALALGGHLGAPAHTRPAPPWPGGWCLWGSRRWLRLSELGDKEPRRKWLQQEGVGCRAAPAGPARLPPETTAVWPVLLPSLPYKSLWGHMRVTQVPCFLGTYGRQCINKSSIDVAHGAVKGGDWEAVSEGSIRSCPWGCWGRAFHVKGL